MNDDDHRKIIIHRISSYQQTGTGPDGKPVKPINKWIALALLIPVLALMAVLGVFFFAAFLALFAIAAVGFSIRLWWLKRKYQNTMHQSDQHTEDGQTVIIEDAEIIEENEVERKKQKKTNSDASGH